MGVALYDDRLAVADGRSGLTLIRIGDPTSLSDPQIEQSVVLGAHATCVHAIGNVAVVGLSDGHLVAVDIVSVSCSLTRRRTTRRFPRKLQNSSGTSLVVMRKLCRLYVVFELVFEREAREFQSFHFFMFQLCDSN